MLYGVPIGFSMDQEIVKGFVARFRDDPQRLARTTIITHSAEFAEVLRAAFYKAGLTLLPKILHEGLIRAHFLPALSLRPRAVSEYDVLAISDLLTRLLDLEPDLFHPRDLYRLAYALVDVMEQVSAEELNIDTLMNLDLGEFAVHWRARLSFFKILHEYWEKAQIKTTAMCASEAIDILARKWQSVPYSDPVFLVGSTGSQVRMQRLMQAVAALPDGHIVFPTVANSFFECMDAPVDLPPMHPHYTIQKMMRVLDISHLVPFHSAPTKMGSFMETVFAPAPQTDLWIRSLDELRTATAGFSDLTILESENTAQETKAIYIQILQALEQGQTVRLATSDRALVSGIKARLDAASIPYGDSVGRVASQTHQGILLRVITDWARAQDVQKLLHLLYHPLVAANARSAHLSMLRNFERRIVRKYPLTDPFAHRDVAREYGLLDWMMTWQGHLSTLETRSAKRTLSEWMAWHLDCFDLLYGEGAELYHQKTDREGGYVILEQMRSIAKSSDLDARPIGFDVYARFFETWLERVHVMRPARQKQASIQISSARDLRFKDADVIIMPSLNEGQFPKLQFEDIWLNRKVRMELGLSLPDQAIALAAHDFLSGFHGARLVLSRAKVEAGTPNIASRFLTRFITLYQAADPKSYEVALERGLRLSTYANRLDLEDALQSRSKRPAIWIPPNSRPSQASVTSLEKLFKNPYVFYARNILKLYEAPVLTTRLDYRKTGDIWHGFFLRLSEMVPLGQMLDTGPVRDIFDKVLSEFMLSSYEKYELYEAFEAFCPEFIKGEIRRRAGIARQACEVVETKELQARSSAHLFTLTARIDRIDYDPSGRINKFYDYKSGKAPYSNKNDFDPYKLPQLPLTSVILADQFSLEKKDATQSVSEIEPTFQVICYNDARELSPKGYNFNTFHSDFNVFLDQYFGENFSFNAAEFGEYDKAYGHLARYQEWLLSDPPDTVLCHE